MRLSLFLLLVSFSAMANVSSVRFRHELTSQTNTGVKQQWRFERTKTNFLLNGLRLTPEQMSRHPQAIEQLKLHPTVKTEHCSAGRYEYVTTRPGLRKIVERGCLGSERFAQLRGAFEALANLK